MRKKDLKYFLSKRYDAMMSRCYHERNSSFKHYGAKGIRVCEAWILDKRKFDTWFTSQLESTGILEDFVQNSRHYCLDRIDAQGHYTPDNCRVITVQASNRNLSSFKLKSIVSAEGNRIKF